MKIYGTTLLIGKTDIDTIYGKFKVYTYQDVIDKKYVMALCYGNLNDLDILHIRIHSSCLTSETLRSMDCECAEQLEGAFETISKNGGILFYLLQSGRGASYISKSRSCQIVQYNQNNITSFDAYKSMGLKNDYRDYRNVKDICTMLNLDSKKFNLLTNNPDKIEKLQQLNLKLNKTISIQIASNPYNRNYLLFKEKIDKYQPYIKPFEPYHLPDNRFIHCATYYLPIKPIDDKIIMDSDTFIKYKHKAIDSELLSNGKLLVKLNPSDITEQMIEPYWFKTYVYYDIASHSEYLVLTYGDSHIIPIVRIHCEFIFNRFPLEDTNYKSRYKKAIMSCICNNSGIIIIANHNGDNTSIGKYVLNNESFDKTSTTPKKNFLPITLLLKHHINDNSIKALYSDTSRPEMEAAFDKANINVKEWICINDNDRKGHSILRRRIESSLQYIKSVSCDPITFSAESIFWVTGIGSSESHAKFFVHMANKYDHFAHFVPVHLFKEEFTRIPKNNRYLVIISQGLSPHSSYPLQYALSLENCENVIILTSITNNNKNKIKKHMLGKLMSKGASVFHYPLENEYKTLMRTVGPICCFFLIYTLFTMGAINIDAIIEKIKQNEIMVPSIKFVSSIILHKNITIIAPQQMIEYCQNLKYKLIEGAFIPIVNLVGDLDFAHGTFQYCMSLKDKDIIPNIITINVNNSKIINLIKKEFNLWEINTHFDTDISIIEVEHIFNLLVLNLIQEMNIDQIDWPGKMIQDKVYELE